MVELMLTGTLVYLLKYLLKYIYLNKYNVHVFYLLFILIELNKIDRNKNPEWRKNNKQQLLTY